MERLHATLFYRSGEWWIEAEDLEEAERLGIPGDATTSDAIRAARDEGYTDVAISI